MKFVKKCDKCQKHANIVRAPLEELGSMFSPWSFYMWGVDILGPFPPAPKQVKFLVVTIDYFTKWVEAEPLSTISAEKNSELLLEKLSLSVRHSTCDHHGQRHSVRKSEG